MDFFKKRKENQLKCVKLPEGEMIDGERVISVWHGSGNEKFFRRRYFDGYTQYETLEDNGKKVMHNVYTGMWYTQELDKKGRITHRLAYLGLMLLGIALMLYASTRYIKANDPYAGLPEFTCLYAFCWVGVALVNELIVPQKRTIGDYRATSLGFRRAGIMAAVSGAAAAVITLGFGIFGGEKVGLHLLAALAELAAGAAGYLIRYLESKVPYTQKISDLAGKYTM